MPLSEHEQRILQEIEAKLYESDPALAREVGSTTLFTHALRNIKWAALGFLGGMVLMVAALSTHWAIAFVGFLIMLLSALAVERNARKMGRAGWQQLTGQSRNDGVRSLLGSTGQKMRERFQRNVEE
ncbi:MAG: DUF3040 domain-containing protein [Acidimicrobiia bacterium]